MHNLTLAELARKLRAKEFSVTELTKALLARIEAAQPKLNAFITVMAESALAQSARAEAALKDGSAGPLTGLPLAHKDIFCTSGVRTSCGSRMLDNFVSPYDATVVEKLECVGDGDAGQDEHGRVRHGLVERDQLVRPGQGTRGT
jgi:aspartyl-tRNA(Asn)/glutamyl-tRNA(Gln) amidotransferase subunit A